MAAVNATATPARVDRVSFCYPCCWVQGHSADFLFLAIADEHSGGNYIFRRVAAPNAFFFRSPSSIALSAFVSSEHISKSVHLVRSPLLSFSILFYLFITIYRVNLRSLNLSFFSAFGSEITFLFNYEVRNFPHWDTRFPHLG